MRAQLTVLVIPVQFVKILLLQIQVLTYLYIKCYINCKYFTVSHIVAEDLQEARRTADKSVQVLMTRTFRSKATQTNVKLVDRASSPFKSSVKSVYTSPFKVKYSMKSKPSGSGLAKISKKIILEECYSDSDVSLYTPPVIRTPFSPSTHSLQMKSSSDCSELLEEKQKQKSTDTIQNTIAKIMNKPRFYIGVPKNSYFLIDIIINETNIPLHCLLLCLKKIRLDSKFQELADDFAMTSSNASKIFLKNVPIIASFMRPFIVKLDSELNKKTLPMSFRHKYNNVSCIIDCLEIEVLKPSKAVHQALTWSDYKKANTIKYLISCTPSGLVNYISPGFGGRTTDTCLVESCDFVQCLEKGMYVMADRGFKHVEEYLQKSGIQLVRPPSVKTGVKLSKCEAKQTKQVASLRIHVERVIRRLREFNMLKPHACTNNNFVRLLDDIITISCALINIQDSLIK